LGFFDSQRLFLFLQLSWINPQKAAEIILIGDFMLRLLLVLWSKLDSVLDRVYNLWVGSIGIGVSVVGLHKGIRCPGGFLLTFSTATLFIQLLVVVS
jgi:hypothetical protein